MLGMRKSGVAEEHDWPLLFAAWLVAATGTAGSLFSSAVLELPPCVLCWYQRIFLFPLVVVLGFALFPLDRRIVRYALPLATLGALVAAYHNLIYEGIVPERLSPCVQGVSCAEQLPELFGFLSIPMLSLIAFAAIAGALVVLHRRSRP